MLVLFMQTMDVDAQTSSSPPPSPPSDATVSAPLIGGVVAAIANVLGIVVLVSKE